MSSKYCNLYHFVISLLSLLIGSQWNKQVLLKLKNTQICCVLPSLPYVDMAVILTCVYYLSHYLFSEVIQLL